MDVGLPPKPNLFLHELNSQILLFLKFWNLFIFIKNRENQENC